MLRGKPVIVTGMVLAVGFSPTTRIFAKGFVGLLGNPRAVGDAFDITSDEWLTWNQIYEIMARAAAFSPSIVHVPLTYRGLRPGMGPQPAGR